MAADYPKFLTDLSDLGQISSPTSRGDLQLSLEVADRLPWTDFSEFWSRSSSGVVQTRFLCFLVDTDLDLDALKSTVPDSSPWELPYIAVMDLGVRMAKAINDLCLACAIARPGYLTTQQGAVLVEADSRYSSGIDAQNGRYLEEVWSWTERLEWPLWRSLPLLQAWRWLNDVRGFEEGVPEGPAGRAVAALSNVLTTQGHLDLVWALLGLEALYGESASGVRSQLVRKTELVLGPRRTHKKGFGNSYDFRSRLVHGDIDIPLAYTPYDALPKLEEYRGELMAATSLCLRVLIATLQAMVEESSYRFAFDWVRRPQVVD